MRNLYLIQPASSSAPKVTEDVASVHVNVDLDLLQRLQARLDDGWHDTVHFGARIPRWLDRRLDTFVHDYNHADPRQRITKAALIAELLLIGFGALPMPPRVDDV